jgi:hypothetical protein
MEARKLRIGNLVNHKLFGYCEVTALDYEMICIQRTDKDIKEWFDLDNFKPIPLTEEWLLRFGFEKVEDDDYLEIKLFSSLKILWLGYLAIEINGYFTSLSEKEQVYVHQLQNLYYCLCGEELTTQELNQ